jgi:hypothetical protein
LEGDIRDGWRKTMKMVGGRYYRWLEEDCEDGWRKILKLVGGRY